MTPEELRAICNGLNDERGTGGQTKLAGLLHWDGSTVRRKRAGKTKITRADELAIEQAVGRRQSSRRTKMPDPAMSGNMTISRDAPDPATGIPATS